MITLEQRHGSLAAVALLLIVTGAAIVIALLINRPAVPLGTPVESYTGVIKEMAATQWLVDDTQVVVDSRTEIHGQPVVGAQITCLAVALQPGDRVRALEVWVNTQPGTPTAPVPAPTSPSGESFPPIMALAP